MSTETTNKKIKIDNGTTFGRTYTDKAVDELLKNAGKLDTVKVTYDVSSSKITADIANKPDGTYVVNIILKTGDTEINVGTKTGLVEIGSLVDMDSGSTIRTLSGYVYFNNLMFFYGIASATATTIDITGGTLAYIPTSYTIDGLVKIQKNGTFGSVDLPVQGQSDSFLVYDTTVGNYDWRPVSEIDNKTISLFGKHSVLVPKDSADTNILPCSTADNGKVLSVVNGEAQWATPTGSGGEEVLNVSVSMTAEQLSRSINNSGVETHYTEENKTIVFDFIKAQKGIMRLAVNTPIGNLYMTLRPSLWKDDINHSYNFEGSLYIETDLSAIGAKYFNQIIVRAICWDANNSVVFRPTIIPIGDN